MSTDNGIMAKIELAFVTAIKAIEYESAIVFKRDNQVDHWRHQVGAITGGLEAFSRYSPFAFVGYQGCEGAREGGYDLREVPTVHVLVGAYNDSPGVARIGDDTHLGVSHLRDLIIAALESKSIASDLGCDECYYIGDQVVVNAEKQFAVEMVFEISKMTPNK
jgi:hypothetical protein